MKVGDLVRGVDDPQDRLGLVLEVHACIGKPTRNGVELVMSEVFWGLGDQANLDGEGRSRLYPTRWLEIVNESSGLGV